MTGEKMIHYHYSIQYYNDMCCLCDPWFLCLMFVCCKCTDTEREQLQPPPVEVLADQGVKKVEANPFSKTGLPKDSHLDSAYI